MYTGIESHQVLQAWHCMEIMYLGLRKEADVQNGAASVVANVALLINVLTLKVFCFNISITLARS